MSLLNNLWNWMGWDKVKPPLPAAARNKPPNLLITPQLVAVSQNDLDKVIKNLKKVKIQERPRTFKARPGIEALHSYFRENNLSY